MTDDQEEEKKINGKKHPIFKIKTSTKNKIGTDGLLSLLPTGLYHR